MAKQLVNPIERHVEKAVAGIAGLLLLGVIARYLVTTPNQLEMGGTNATPSTIDGIVARKALDVRRRVESATPPPVTFESIKDQFAQSVRPFDGVSLTPELSAAVARGPVVPLVDVVMVDQTDKCTLVEVVPVDKPRVTQGRSTIDASGNVVSDWATVSTIFDRQEQTDRQARNYGFRWRDVIVAPLEVERRERRYDGTWSEEDWKSITTWPAFELPRIPDVPLSVQDRQTIVLKEHYRNIERFIDRFSKPKDQLEVMRPVMPRIVNGSPWTFPVLTSIRDVALQDEEFLAPNDPPSPNPSLVRYPGMETGESEKAADESASPQEQIKRRFTAIEQLLLDARKYKNEADAINAFNMASELQKESHVSPADKDRARKRADEAAQTIKDIKLWHQQNPQGKPAPDSREPSKFRREPMPRHQLWAHDARPGSLVGGQTYQYRVRAVILNRLVGQPEKFREPENATEIFLRGPWSDPSDPVTIEHTAQFFAKGHGESRNNTVVKLDLFQWFQGIWVQHSANFSVGELISTAARVPVPDPENPEEPFRAEVSFQADAVIVDIDPTRKSRVPKKTTGGLKVFPPEKTCSLVLVNPNGALEERIVEVEKEDPRKNVLRDRLWKAPKPKR